MRRRKIKYRLITPTLVYIAPSIETRYYIAIRVYQCRFQRCIARTHDRLTQIVEAVTQVIFRRLAFAHVSVATEGVPEY